MAVRHGYGKIAGADALLVAYDTGDTRNSYRGEPTTNLATDTPSQNGWGGSYSVLQSSTKTFQMQLDQAGAATAWRSWYWSVSSYIGSYITISFDFELLETSGADLLYFVMGQGNTGTYPNFLAGSAEADKVTDSTGVTRHFTWSGVINAAGLVGCTMRMTNGVTNGYIKFKISNVQIEAKAHETPFVNGTRSDTNGLLDLTGNVTIDLSPSGFDSNAKPYFDGVSERIAIGDPGYPSSGTDPFTLEIIYRVPTGATWYNQGSGTGFIGRGSYGGSMGIFRGGTDGQVAFWVRLDGGNIYDPNVTGLSRDVYNHIVGTFDGTDTAKIYHNGQYITQEVNANNAGTFDAGGFNVGGGTSFGGSNGGYGEGEVPVVKLYNRVLTAQEVLNNFNFYKGRFGM